MTHDATLGTWRPELRGLSMRLRRVREATAKLGFLGSLWETRRFVGLPTHQEASADSGISFLRDEVKVAPIIYFENPCVFVIILHYNLIFFNWLTRYYQRESVKTRIQF